MIASPIIKETLPIEGNAVDFLSQLAKDNPTKSICININEFTDFLEPNPALGIWNTNGFEMVIHREYLVNGYYGKLFNTYIIVTKQVPPGEYAIIDYDYIKQFIMKDALS